MNSVILRRFVLVFCFGVSGTCFAGGASSRPTGGKDAATQIAQRAQKILNPHYYRQAQEKWQDMSGRAQGQSVFFYGSESYTNRDTLFAKIIQDMGPDGQEPYGAGLCALMGALSSQENNYKDVVEAFHVLVLELSNLSREEDKIPCAAQTIQKTHQALEALLQVLVLRINDKDPKFLETVRGAAELPLALCVAYESLDLLTVKTPESSRRSFGLENFTANEARSLAALAIVVSLGAYKIHTRHPKMITINGIQYPYVTPRILRDRNVANLTSPTEITRERNKLLRKTIGYWDGSETHTKLANERYEEICTAVCYHQPIEYYSADMKDVCSYATWQEAIKTIHQNLDLLEKSTLIVPVKELRDFTKLIDWDSKPPYKNQIQDIYEFAPSLRQYYKRASREFWGLMKPEARPKKQSSEKLSLKYCKQAPSQGEQSNNFHLCAALHGLKRGPRCRSSYADLIQGFQVTQNILEALFHVIVIRVHAATGRFYEHFPTFLAELYGRTMHFVYPPSMISPR